MSLHAGCIRGCRRLALLLPSLWTLTSAHAPGPCLLPILNLVVRLHLRGCLRLASAKRLPSASLYQAHVLAGRNCTCTYPAGSFPPALPTAPTCAQHCPQSHSVRCMPAAPCISPSATLCPVPCVPCVPPRLSSVLGSVTVSRSKRVAFDLGKQRCMLPRADLRADEAAGGMHLLRVRLLCLAQLRVHQRFTFDSRLLCVLTDSSASPLLQ